MTSVEGVIRDNKQTGTIKLSRPLFYYMSLWMHGLEGRWWIPSTHFCFIPQCPQQLPNGGHRSGYHTVFFPDSCCTDSLYFPFLVNLHDLTARVNEVDLFLQQRVLSFLQSLTYSSWLTSHSLLARGTHLVCSMGVLYQLIKGHRRGNARVLPLFHLSYFSFHPNLGLFLQAVRGSNFQTHPSQWLTSHYHIRISFLVLLLLLCMAATRLDSPRPGCTSRKCFLFSHFMFGGFPEFPPDRFVPTENCPFPCRCSASLPQ